MATGARGAPGARCASEAVAEPGRPFELPRWSTSPRARVAGRRPGAPVVLLNSEVDQPPWPPPPPDHRRRRRRRRRRCCRRHSREAEQAAAGAVLLHTGTAVAAVATVAAVAALAAGAALAGGELDGVDPGDEAVVQVEGERAAPRVALVPPRPPAPPWPPAPPARSWRTAEAVAAAAAAGAAAADAVGAGLAVDAVARRPRCCRPSSGHRRGRRLRPRRPRGSWRWPARRGRCR